MVLRKLQRVRHLVIAAVVAIGATLLLTWPLAADPGHHVLEAAFHWDAYTNAMIMGSRVDAALGQSALFIYDNYFFAPLPNTIVFNENHFGLSWLFAPTYLLTAQPLLAYNVTLLLSLSLSVFITFLFVRRLTSSTAAGLVAGVAFAFCPYVMFELGRIQLVATQWIPACFLFLHRTFENHRRRDIAAFFFFFLMQVGTCLYYAMFLVPLLSVMALALAVRNRPPARSYTWLGGGAVVAGAIALALVFPYFQAREAFDLERTLAFASSYDGSLGFFTNVPETNRSLPWMHQPLKFQGAFEEIAFPGFVVLALSLFALGWALRDRARRFGTRVIGKATLFWAVAAGVALLLSTWSHSMLVGFVVVGVAVGLRAWRGSEIPSRNYLGTYAALLVLAVVLFLGLFPFEYDGRPVHGLYYYLHTYFPGFNGIRKVSRQAVMTSFICAVLAGFGAARMLMILERRWQQSVALVSLGLLLCFELRCFPHPVHALWAGDTTPKVLRFAASLPDEDLIASIPQDAGVSQFRGDEGMAFHNYLALYHKHEFVNGQSSWMPPATELVRRSLQQLPADAARRVLESVGARHLIIYADDLPPNRRNLPARLAADTEHYQLAFRDGEHYVFTLRHTNTPQTALLQTPALPANAELIPRTALQARASGHAGHGGLALDGDPSTRWSMARPQRRGQYFELMLDQPREVVALELTSPGHVFDTPASFHVDVAGRGFEYRTVFKRPTVRLYRDQVMAPKRFVFRLVLEEPVEVDRIRITVDQPLPRYYFSINEVRLYSQ